MYVYMHKGPNFIDFEHGFVKIMASYDLYVLCLIVLHARLSEIG